MDQNQSQVAPARATEFEAYYRADIKPLIWFATRIGGPCKTLRTPRMRR